MIAYSIRDKRDFVANFVPPLDNPTREQIWQAARDAMELQHGTRHVDAVGGFGKKIFYIGRTNEQ